MAQEYKAKDVVFIAISTNDAKAFPQDSPEQVKALTQKKQFSFPYLYDETQEAAKAYKAAYTPDFYIFDKDLACVYRGQFDDSRPGNFIPASTENRCQANSAFLNNDGVALLTLSMCHYILS